MKYIIYKMRKGRPVGRSKYTLTKAAAIKWCRAHNRRRNGLYSILAVHKAGKSWYGEFVSYR